MLDAYQNGQRAGNPTAIRHLKAAAAIILDALCPPGSRVVVDRTKKPCDACHGGERDMDWLFRPDIQPACTSCGGSGVVEATTIYGPEAVDDSDDTTPGAYWVNGRALADEDDDGWDEVAAGAPCLWKWGADIVRLVALPEETPQ